MEDCSRNRRGKMPRGQASPLPRGASLARAERVGERGVFERGWDGGWGMLDSFIARGAFVLVMAALLASGSGCGSKKEETTAEQSDEESADQNPLHFVEIDLGEYFITRPPTNEEAAYYIRFHIFGIVREKDESDFTTAMDERGKRMRDSVIEIAQRTDLEHLRDPGLTWLKSELVPIINKKLRCQLLQNVVFTDFTAERG